MNPETVVVGDVAVAIVVVAGLAAADVHVPVPVAAMVTTELRQVD